MLGRIIISVAVGVIMMGDARADEIPVTDTGAITAGWYAETCSETAGTVQDALCTGYINGIADALVDGKRVCIPQAVTLGQRRKVATKFLNDHPEWHHLEGYRVIRMASTLTWPCPK